MEKTDLDAINSTHGSDTDACFIEMLSLWLKQTKSLPTWSKMIRALKRPTVGFQHLAEKIEMKLNIVDKKRIEQFQFPFINEIAPNEESRKELEGRLRAQTKDIILEFNILIQQLFDTLEDQILIQNYSVQRLARYLRTYGAVNLESIDDVQSFIAERSSFFDYEILRYIIRLAGAERDKRNLQEYENHFKVYARRRVYECPSMISGASSENSDSQSSKLCIKLDSEYDKYTLNELKEFQYRLCNILNLPVCMLISIERGCLRLTFAIIHSEASFPLCKKQKARLIELGVLQLEYKEYTYSFQPNIEHKVQSMTLL